MTNDQDPNPNEVGVERVTVVDAGRWKAIRLRALLDASSAFGATYAAVSQWSAADWDRRMLQLAGDRQAGYLAVDGDADVGMTGGALDDADPTRAGLISMWVAPAHRARGVGRLLVARVAAWARSRGATTLTLHVTSSNAGARRFYDQLGFAPTGRTEPYPNDPALVEFEMSRPL